MSAAPQVQPVRLVIIDDTVELRELLRFALEQHEFTVVGEAPDGHSGIELVAQTQPDLVLLDLAMPVMDGFEALPQVRRACRGAKIVVLSGFDPGGMATRARDLGADGYLQKGASLSASLAYVREMMGLATGTGLPAPRDSQHPATRTAAQIAGQGGAAAAAAHLAVVEGAGQGTTPGPLPGPLAAVPDQPTDSPDSLGRPADARESHAWLRQVPFGVVEVDDGPGLVVRTANPAASRLLGVELERGRPLDESAPALAALVGHGGDGALELPAPHPGDKERMVTVTRLDDALVLVVSP